MALQCDDRSKCSTAAIGLIILLSSCSDRTPPRASTDIVALREVVELPLPIRSAKWEIFYHPEKVGGQMDNLESTILVAEIEPADPKWLERKLTPIMYPYLGPDDARPWLSPDLRVILSDESVNARLYDCSSYETIGVTSRERINGFACSANDKTLLYLVLQNAD